MDFSRSNNVDDNVGIPEDLRCKRSDGKQWRCSALSMPDKTVCEKHYIQAKKRAANSALRASLKKAKRKSVDDDDIYLECKIDDGDLSLMDTEGGEFPMSVSTKKHKEKASKRQPSYSPERVSVRSISGRRIADDLTGDDPHVGDHRSKSAYKTPPSGTDSFRSKSQKTSNDVSEGEQSSKSSDSCAEAVGQTCHQCRRNDRTKVNWCLRCQKRGYCEDCISKWYPEIPLQEIQRACPACCGSCNCKICFRPESLIKVRIREITPRDKLQYLHRILSLVLPVIKKIHVEQSLELELETRTQGVKTDVPRVKIHPDEQMCCDCCKVPIIDYHRHCSNCLYDLCLTCCRDIRQASLANVTCELTENLKTGKDQDEPAIREAVQSGTVDNGNSIDLLNIFPEWRANSDGSIPCPPKECGGCGYQALSLRRIFKMNWVAKLVKNSEEMVHGCKISGTNEVPSCFISSSEETSYESLDVTDSTIVKAATRQDSNDNYLYCPTSHDIKQDGIGRFQKHWLRGEPILVKHMADCLLTSGWDPEALWRGIQEIAQENVKEDTDLLKVIDCLDGSEIEVNAAEFIKGYSDGCLHRDGSPQLLKLKDWPRPSVFEEFLYYHRPEFVSKLPMLEYIHSKWGLLNLAAKLPHDSLPSDVGPKLSIFYGLFNGLSECDSVINLHVNMSDVAYMLMHTSEVRFLGWPNKKDEKKKETIVAVGENESVMDSCGAVYENLEKGPNFLGLPKEQLNDIECGLQLNAREDEILEDRMHAGTSLSKNEEVSLSQTEREIKVVGSEKTSVCTLWDVFRRQDVPKLNEFLRIHWQEFEGSSRFSVEPSGVHPIHDQAVFLDRDQLLQLKKEFGVEPWTFEQDMCEAVFIPAGCPFQVRNLKSNVQLSLDFLSPESLGESVNLGRGIRCLPNDHEAKLQMLEVGKMSLYAASSAIREIQKLTLDRKIGRELGPEDQNLTALVSANIEKMVKWRQIACV